MSNKQQFLGKRLLCNSGCAELLICFKHTSVFNNQYLPPIILLKNVYGVSKEEIWLVGCRLQCRNVPSNKGLLLFSRLVVSDSVTPWTTACQAFLSFTIPWSLLRFMSIESVMSSNHLILCCPLLLLPSIFPSIRVFANESALPSGGQNTGASALASVLPMNSQNLFPLGLTGLKRLRVAKAS